MDMLKLMLLAAEEDTDSSFDGLFSGARGVMGIVLMVTGLLIIYIAVKVFKGYRFLPMAGERTVVEEDNYVETEAKALQKKKSTLPDFNGGEDREFVEWKIGYTVDGEKYTQLIPDDGYEKGDMLKIKYNPDKPEEFYLVDGEQTEEREDTEEAADPSENSSRTTGLVLTVLGVLVIIGGAALTFI